MRKLLTLVALSSITWGYAQLTEVKSHVNKAIVEPKNDTLADGWHKSGTISLLFNQSAFSNWVAGGVNNIAGNVNAVYDANYKKGDLLWDNRINLAYGLTKNENQDYRKTDDRIEINTLVGKKAWGNWSYSFFGNFRTQFTDGYDYDNDENQDYPISGFFNPAYLTFGPGMMWKKHDNLKFNLAPLTSKFTFIGDDIYKYDSAHPLANANGFINNNDVELYGVEPGKSSRYELGFYAAGYYKLQLMDNVTMENILALYSNYLEEPKNVDMDYTMNLGMQINKYLSTLLTLQLVYDDNAYAGLQVREVFGLGVTAKF
ncbi:DUF3078 domain-containing protein [Flavobacteriaceae bacterium Ap0902]|nr:DUF3078 domain-containing protein [Flavobacteriaceae bacterium Ap0902]